MAIKAFFPAGKDSITVNGLYQWDYGQVLEIESADIGSEIVEVHFACKNMFEAIVRPCTFANGIGTVVIPDDCLEQSSAITAWLYRIVGTQGHTFGTIILPVTERTRPSISRDIPQEVSNRYTELITEVNEAVDALETGNVTVKKAESATSADTAKTAGNASSANYATSAGSAGVANLLSMGGDYVNYFRGNDEEPPDEIEGGLIMFCIERVKPGPKITIIAEVGDGDGTHCMYSGIFYDYVPYGKVSGFLPIRLVFDPTETVGGSGWYAVRVEAFNVVTGDFANLPTNEYLSSISYKYLSPHYPAD